VSLIHAITDPGAQPVARLYRDGVAAGSVPMAKTDQAGFYTASIPAALAAGAYQVLILVGQEIVGSGELLWDGSREVTLRDTHERLGLGAPRLVSPEGETGGGVDLTFTNVNTTATRIERVA
jgi:hypothetical protein